MLPTWRGSKSLLLAAIVRKNEGGRPIDLRRRKVVVVVVAIVEGSARKDEKGD